MLDASVAVGVSGEDLDIPSDGAVLRGRILRPKGTPRAALVLHGATGAPARYYRGFAEWAARERDLAVLTYDYRDFGASLRRPLRDSTATLADWDRNEHPDVRAIMKELSRSFASVPPSKP